MRRILSQISQNLKSNCSWVESISNSFFFSISGSFFDGQSYSGSWISDGNFLSDVSDSGGTSSVVAYCSSYIDDRVFSVEAECDGERGQDGVRGVQYIRGAESLQPSEIARLFYAVFTSRPSRHAVLSSVLTVGGSPLSFSSYVTGTTETRLRNVDAKPDLG